MRSIKETIDSFKQARTQQKKGIWMLRIKLSFPLKKLLKRFLTLSLAMVMLHGVSGCGTQEKIFIDSCTTILQPSEKVLDQHDEIKETQPDLYRYTDQCLVQSDQEKTRKENGECI